MKKESDTKKNIKMNVLNTTNFIMNANNNKIVCCLSPSSRSKKTTDTQKKALGTLEVIEIESDEEIELDFVDASAVDVTPVLESNKKKELEEEEEDVTISEEENEDGFCVVELLD